MDCAGRLLSRQTDPVRVFNLKRTRKSADTNDIEMEEEEKTLTISDLIQYGHPLTAVSSSIIPIHTSNQQTHNTQNHKTETLIPLTISRPFIGNITLPSFSNTPHICTCFQFSDNDVSTTICCYVLHFEPKMIGQNIQVLSWNFIPTKCAKRGFLEIIKWTFLQHSFTNTTGNSCSFSRLCSFCWVDKKHENTAGNSFVFGVIESVSPVSTVPCSFSREESSKAVKIRGFLVRVMVCECKLCSSKYLVSEFNEENVGCHLFTKVRIVYFCGQTSSWHPVISRLIGNVVFVSMLKKKLVVLGKEESQLMYVAMDYMSLHVLNLSKKQIGICDGEVRGKGEYGMYTGVVSGVYMQGMVVELDEDVMVLLTDQYLSVPHCLRIGAIVTMKNVHVVHPKFAWGSMLILGACYRTSVFVESFSPLKSGCYLRSYSVSPLQNFIDSLPYSPRLWVLLVIQCFRKKFSGLLPDQEIVGSKHKEGLVQKFASLHLPFSAIQKRCGVLLEFCKHDLCSDVDDACYGHLKLVPPIVNVINYCDVSWKKILGDWEKNADFVEGVNLNKSLCCDGRYYEQPVRSVFRSEEIGFVVLGVIKFSSSSGRLQLRDETGGLDIMLSLPPTWDFKKFFVAKDFVIVMEGTPRKLVYANSVVENPLRCRSIFNNAHPLLKLTTTSLYLYHVPNDEDARSDSLFFEWRTSSKELGSGKYHLLMLTHKFPMRQKGYQANRSSRFAQAMVLPWDLLVAAKHRDIKFCEKLINHKRCKISQVSNCNSIGAGNGSGHLSRSSKVESNSFRKENNSTSNDLLEIPCFIVNRRLQCHSPAILCCTSDYANIVSGCKPPRNKVLLEFGPNSVCIYEVLKVGCCYLFEQPEQEKLFSTKKNYKLGGAKIHITSDTHLWNLNISSLMGLNSSDVFSLHSLHASSENLIPGKFEISPQTKVGIGSEINTDIDVYVDADAKNSVLNVIKILENSTSEPTNSFNQSSGSWCVDDPLLLVGNLITLHGLVLGLHECDGPGQLRSIPHDGCLPVFLQRNGCVCIHLLVGNCLVTILCDISKQAQPIGLAQNVSASFHRVLVLSEPSKYIMLPVSFITINDIGLLKNKCDAELSSKTAGVGSETVAFPDAVPTELMYDLMQSSLLKPKQFRFRVVAVYLLVLEKTEKPTISQSGVQARLSMGIPLAGFIMDDGSSSCCCWSESESAATLLCINSGDWYMPLNRILEQHHRVVVRNYGSLIDSSCQDLSFSSLGSDKSISSLDEVLLTSLVMNPSLSTSSWVVTGSIMDQEACKRLENRSSALGTVLPPLPNVFATSVGHKDILAEARSIFHELV